MSMENLKPLRYFEKKYRNEMKRYWVISTHLTNCFNNTIEDDKTIRDELIQYVCNYTQKYILQKIIRNRS